MKILQSGVAKSGNYWLWKILDETLKYSNNEVKKFVTSTEEYKDILNSKKLSNIDQISTDVIDVDITGFYWRISSYHKQKIVNIKDYIDKSTHVWTHSEYCNQFKKIENKFDKIIYIIRDPRDVAISMANFAFTDYVQEAYPHFEEDVSSYIDNRIKWQTMTWNKHVSGWLSNQPDNMYVIFYENLKSNFDYEFRLLLDFLEINIEENTIEHIKKKVSIDSMKKDSPGHVRKGVKGGWIKFLSDEQLKKANSSCIHLLEILNYQLDRNEENNLMPSYHKNDHRVFNVYKKSNVSIFTTIKAVISLFKSKRSFKDKVKVVKKKIISMTQVFINK